MTLNRLDKLILQNLSRVRFATRSQLAYWCVEHVSNISNRLILLEKAKIVTGETHTRPTIWSITPLGASLMLTSPPSGGRRSSWTVMSHVCHRNAVEILLAAEKESAGFHFLDHQYLVTRGLNPAFGEHCGTDNEGRIYLVLIDDYLMKSSRIAHTWNRVHHPPRKYFSGNRVFTWPQFVNYFIVATTDELRAEKHQAWIEKNVIPARVIVIKPLWR